MTKFLFHRETGNKCVFDDDASLEDWPDYQETLPTAIKVITTRIEELLASTDTWVSLDRTMTNEQIQYRQALMNIPNHANWPNLDESDWPIKPV